MHNSTTNTTLTERINNFHYYYEMSNNDKTYRLGQQSEKEIKEQLSKMSNSELIELKNTLTVSIEDVKRYFPIFNDLTQPTTETEPTTPNKVTDSEPSPTPSNVKVSYKSNIFKTAWTLLKNGTAETFGKALSLAWKRFKAVQLLKNGIAYFTYKKADNTERKAIGTLRTGNFNYVAKTDKPRSSKPSIIKYFDIEIKQFRSFRIDRLIEIAA